MPNSLEIHIVVEREESHRTLCERFVTFHNALYWPLLREWNWRCFKGVSLANHILHLDVWCSLNNVNALMDFICSLQLSNKS